MTIQISIAIWTVICFILLMIILRNFLFKPVLKDLDDRRQRLENARLKEKEQIRKAEENEVLILKQKAEFAKKKEQLAKEAAENLNAQGKLQIEEAQKKRISDVDKYRASMDESYKQIISTASVEMNKVAEIFAAKIISHRD